MELNTILSQASANILNAYENYKAIDVAIKNKIKEMKKDLKKNNAEYFDNENTIKNIKKSIKDLKEEQRELMKNNEQILIDNGLEDLEDEVLTAKEKYDELKQLELNLVWGYFSDLDTTISSVDFDKDHLVVEF